MSGLADTGSRRRRWAPTSTADGTTFGLFSSVAEAVNLCLFDDDGPSGASP